jgi:Fe-S-cluster-containing hydrogenase components 1
MAKYGLTIDIEKCCGCYACFLACRDEYSGKDHLPSTLAQPDGQKWLNVVEIEYGEGSKIKVDYVPKLCKHCENPVCASNAPDGAVVVREDGIVLFDTEKSKGWSSAVKECPEGVVYWNEDASVPQKCTLCVHMLDDGEKTTRCAECCPTGALVYGPLPDDAKELVQVINLPKPFIAGEIAYSDKPGEPAVGVTVKLLDDNGTLCDTCQSNFLGDFEFKGLSKDCTYRLLIEQDGYEQKEIMTGVDSGANLGTIMLSEKEEK